MDIGLPRPHTTWIQRDSHLVHHLLTSCFPCNLDFLHELGSLFRDATSSENEQLKADATLGPGHSFDK